MFRRVADLQAFLNAGRTNNRAVGFVPTMGALHDGHLSLVRHALSENQLTVASIFVNPTQFNDASDLERYPRTPGKDMEKLAAVGCDVVFLPDVADVYPVGTNYAAVDIDWHGLDAVMEGTQRPGHFAGVAQVVKRLLDIVQPTNLYMGQKDYQQQRIIRELVSQLHLPTRVVTVATEREADGLAMSSRNTLLRADIRSRAVLLYEQLLHAKNRLEAGEAVATIEAEAMQALTQPDFRPEYFSIVDGDTLQPVQHAAQHALVVACTAVWAGSVRLIDNMILKGK